jgi:hypothetical protein
MSEFPRPLTEQEWLRRALALLPTGEYLGGGRWRDAQTGELQPLDPPIDPEPYLAQIDSLQVVDACRCGDPKCHYVRFQHYRPGKSYALVHTKFPQRGSPWLQPWGGASETARCNYPLY